MEKLDIRGLRKCQIAACSCGHQHHDHNNLSHKIAYIYKHMIGENRMKRFE